MLDSARRKTPVPALARWLLGLGIAATLAANVAHGLGHGLAGAAVAAWPAVALVGSCELLIRASAVPGSRQMPRQRPSVTQIRCRSGRPCCSPRRWRWTGFVRSLLSSMSASLEHSGFETTSQQEQQGGRTAQLREQPAAGASNLADEIDSACPRSPASDLT
jgi:hypothetical protein